MPKVNADRKLEWLEFEISLGEEIGQLLATEDPSEMGQRIGNVIEERRGEIHRHLAERIDQAISEEVERLVEGHTEGRTNRDLKRLDERYFRLRFQLEAIVTTAGVDGRPMRRTESVGELFDRGQSRPRATGATDGGGDASARGNRANDKRSNTFNPNNPASAAAASNRSNQMNPNNSAYRSSRGGNR